MTAAELIAELRQFPPDTPVAIEGFERGTELSNYRFDPCHVEGVRSAVSGDSIVIWAIFSPPS